MLAAHANVPLNVKMSPYTMLTGPPAVMVTLSAEPNASQLARNVRERPKMVKMLKRRLSCWRTPICAMTCRSSEERLWVEGEERMCGEVSFSAMMLLRLVVC
jgi:hypothetical protein